MVTFFAFTLKDTPHLANRLMNALAANATNTYNDGNSIFFKSSVVMQRANKDRVQNSENLNGNRHSSKNDVTHMGATNTDAVNSLCT